MFKLLDKSKRLKLDNSLFILVACIIFLGPVRVSFAATLPSDDTNSIYNDTVWYDPSNSVSNSSAYDCSTTYGSVSTTQAQSDIIKIIIGIAKTDNLGKTGAVIGLMAGDDESGFKILANSNVPVSLSIPNQGVGSNGNSVGVFQQQPNYGWSTIDTGTSALTNRAALAQLMDPAYSAEAFFGSPAGSNAPSALSKGLQNINWKSMSPAEAASTVQGNLAGASVYANFQADAEAFVNQYWDSSPAVPLPVPLNNTGTPGTDISGAQLCSGSTPLGTYKNPFRAIQQAGKLRAERIDEGVDYGGEGPVYALGDGKITNLTNSGWNFGGYDAFVGELLTSGPAKGLYVYMAEACVPRASLQIGDVVNADTIICDMINPTDTGIETGWAAPPGVGAAIANGQYDKGATAYGVNYNQLLVKLGAPSGINETNSVTGTLPTGWPKW